MSLIPDGIKRILIVLPGIGALGGAERQALLLARLLRGAGAELEVWGKGEPGEVARQCDAMGVTTRQVALEPRVRPLRLWLNLRAFRRKLKAGRFDWVIPYTTGPNIFCAMTWRGAARACIWNQRDEGQRLGIAPVDFKAAQAVPVLVSNSVHGALMLTEKFGVDIARTRVVHNGVELAPPVKPPERWALEMGLRGRPSALMAANLTPRKDHATLIRAWATVQKQVPGAVLVLAGTHGETHAACKALAREAGVEALLRMPGAVADIAGLIGAVDMGVFSSRLEGCPNGVLECMAAGLAVAGTSIPGIEEALGSADTLAPPGDADALAARIVALLADPEARRAAGDRNRARIEAEFSPQAMAEGMIRALVEAGT